MSAATAASAAPCLRAGRSYVWDPVREDHGHTTIVACGNVLADPLPGATDSAAREDGGRLRDVVVGVAAVVAAWEGEASDCEPDLAYTTARARDQRRHLATLRACAAGLRRVLAGEPAAAGGVPGPPAVPPARLLLARERPLIAAVTQVIRDHHGLPAGQPMVWEAVQVTVDHVRAETRIAVVAEAMAALREVGEREAAAVVRERCLSERAL